MNLTNNVSSYINMIYQKKVIMALVVYKRKMYLTNYSTNFSRLIIYDIKKRKKIKDVVNERITGINISNNEMYILLGNSIISYLDLTL